MQIGDAGEYSLILQPDEHPCIVFPAALYDHGTCPPDAKPVSSLPPGAGGTLNVGFLPLDDGSRVLLVASRLPSSDVPQPADIAAFARGTSNELAASRPGASVQGVPSGAEVQIGGLSMVRAAFDVDGFLPNGRAHGVAYTTWTNGGAYTLTLMGSASRAADVDALGYRLIARLHVAHPVPYAPPSSASRLGQLVGSILFPLVAIVALAVFFAHDRKKRRQAQPPPPALPSGTNAP